MIMQKLAYDGKFEGNILVVGRTECGKTSFIERLAVNNVFGKLTKIKWVSQISLSKQREAQIQSNFDCPLSFQYPKNVEELDSLLEELKTKIQLCIHFSYYLSRKINLEITSVANESF